MTFNESDLIAYQLNELSPRRARAVQRALAADPALAAEAEAIAWTLRAFSHAPLPTVDPSVLDRNWQSLRPSLAVLTPAPSFWRRPLTLITGLALAAAAIIGVAFLATEHIPVRTTTTASNSAPATPPNNIASATPSAEANTTAASTNAMPQTSAPSTAVSGNSLSSLRHRATNLSSGPEAAHLAAAAERPAGSAAATTGNLGLSGRAISTLGALNSAATTDAAAPAAPNAAVKRTAPTSVNQTVEVAAESASVQAPLQASLTNSVPLQKSAQTLHTYSASTIVPPAVRAIHPHETDISLGAFAAVASDSSATFNGALGSQTTSQTIAPAGGFVVAVHHQVRPYAGYQAAFGHSRQAFNSTTVSSSGTQGGFVPADAYEMSAAYVVSGPHSHRIATHAAAGAAALDFVPTSGAANSHHVLRPAGLFTVGLDYHLKHRWSLRAEYRALFFKSPNLLNATTVTGYTVSSEPTISLNYRLDSMVRP